MNLFYISNISNKFINIIKDSDFNLAFYDFNKLIEKFNQSSEKYFPINEQ